MSGHHDWQDVRRELGIADWEQRHPWQYRRIRFRMWMRRVVWKLTRIDIG